MGKLYKMYLTEKVHRDIESYEDERGNIRSESTTSSSFTVLVKELEISPEWWAEYKQKEDEVKEAFRSLQKSLTFMGMDYRQADLTIELPHAVAPNWKELHCEKIDLSKDEYNTLSNCALQKEGEVYFHLHYGIRGQYLQLFSSPAVERHPRKGYLDKFVDLKTTGRNDNAALSVAGKILEQATKQRYDWDNRYMPEQHEQSPNRGSQLGDLLKGIKL